MSTYDRLQQRRRLALVRDAAFLVSVGIVATALMRIALAV